ncbi:lacto-N-biose phosphorylase central domain-containing protein, partial [uncultured Cetobacterium sp.]
KEKENTLQFTKRDKVNIENHYIVNDFKNINLEVGFASRNIYSTNENLEILDFDINDGVKLSGNTFGEGRGVYISGLPYTIENARVLQKAIIWASTKEEDMYLTTNINTEVYFYEKSKKIAVINNSKEKQVTKIVCKNKEIKEVALEAYEMQWHLV